MNWRIAIDTHHTAASERALDTEHGEVGSQAGLSRRTIGKIIGVAAVGAAAGGTLGSGVLDALPATAAERLPAAAESKSSSSTTHRLFPHTNGPRTAISYKGNFMAGVGFEATTGGCWLEGFWWWVCHRGQSTKAQKFALWQAYNLAAAGLEGKLIAGTTVESKRLHAGRWNYIPLHKPVPLAIGATYVAATGFKNGFPLTKHQFGKGEKYGHGIKSGPLLAYSDITGTNPPPFGASQALFSIVDGTDPAKHFPGLGDGQSSNFWMDLQITTKAPKGVSYRLWPNFPIPGGSVNSDIAQQSCGTEFWLSEACGLDKIWFYSPPGATVLPDQCAIWDVATQTMVSGTLDTSPTWSGKAASGWVSNAYSGITLQPGKYKTTLWHQGGGVPFFTELPFYFGNSLDTGQPGPAATAGISNGPLYSPNLANASLAEANGTVTGVPAGTLVPANSTYQNNTSEQAGLYLYPYTFDSKDNGENRWIDVEVTPT